MTTSRSRLLSGGQHVRSDALVLIVDFPIGILAGDICVLTERPVNRTEIILQTRVIGGICMIDDGEADDKIIAVMKRDAVYGNAQDIGEIPAALVDRLQHYFSTYKLLPGSSSAVTVAGVYGRDHAMKVVQASIEDYEEEYGSEPLGPDGS